MKNLLYLMVLIFSVNAFTSTQVKREEITSLLPKDLSSLNHEDITTLNKKFKNKISSKDQYNLYLNYNSANDVTLGVKDNHFKYVLINATDEMKAKSLGLFGRVFSNLSAEEKSLLTEQMNSTSHEAGRTISISLPKEGVRLEFNNNEKKTLQSVTLWPVGGEHP